jgi:hypothetical protein
MNVFCLLWTPLFYLFWRSLYPVGAAGAGGILALILGSLFALFEFFFGALIGPGGFGFSRWLSGCVDLVTLPALLPLVVYLVMAALRAIPGTADFTGFALLWIIPMGALRAINWGAQGDPILLVLTPLLWTALVGGLPFLGIVVLRGPRPAKILAVPAFLALPFLTATTYWAFFCQDLRWGIPSLVLSLAPLLGSCVFAARGVSR